MSAPIDIDALNEAARPVYDVAYRDGVQAGRRAATTENVEYAQPKLLELAESLLRLAGDLEGGHRRRAVQIARNLISRTPGSGQGAGPMADALRILGRALQGSHDDVDTSAIIEAHDALGARP